MADKLYRGKTKKATFTTAAADTTVVAAVTSKRIKVISLVVNAGTTASVVKFESGTGGDDISGSLSLAANATVVLPEAPSGWFETDAGDLLNIEVTGGDAIVSGHLNYLEV